MAVEVISIAPEFESILGFLYPNYSFVDNLFKFKNFIIHKEITTKNDRERLNYQYEDAVFISSRIFDEVWTVDVIKQKVLEFAQRRFGSRKKVLKTLNVEGKPFVDECVNFMFTGKTFEEEENRIDALFKSYGSQSFFREFLTQCKDLGVNRTVSSMETFVGKVLSDTESIYYKRAKMRLELPLHQNIVGALQDYDNIDPFFMKKFKDLSKLRLLTMLMRREYYG
jgi:hypothetical protein|nr:MAG TPA: hypothetical protein [Caudoviricetes sp.]